MIRRIFLTGFLMVSLLAVQLSAQNNVRKADTQFELLDYKGAIASYMSCDITNNDIISKIAQCYIAKGDDMKAVDWFSKLDAAYASKVAIDHGLCLKRLGMYNEAKDVFSILSTPESNYQLASCDFALDLLTKENTEVYPAAFNTNKADFGLSFVNGQPVFCSFANDLSFINPVRQSSGNRLYSAEASSTLNESRVYNLRPAIKANYSLGPISYSDDLVAFTKNSFQNESKITTQALEESSIHFGKVTLGGDFEDEFAFSHNIAGFGSAFPALSADGQRLFFASNRPGGYGGFDIYVSTLINGSWSLPVNLGPEVNTFGNEITPCLSEEKLLFASDYQMGLGGYDLFESTLDGVFWSTPINLGNGINSPADDYFPAFLEGTDRVYFSSNRIGGRGLDDIYVSEKLSVEETPPPVFVLGKPTQDKVVNQEAMAVAYDEVIERSVVNHFHIPLNYTSMDLSDENNAEERETRITLAEPNTIEGIKTSEFIMDRSIDLPTMEPVSSTELVVDLASARRSFEGADLPPVASVYFVQLAAFKRKSVNLSDFEKLVQYGNIYKVYLSTAVKVRLGYFTNEEEARAILRKVKADGYRDAFVTYQPLDITNLELVYSNYDYDAPKTSNQTSTSTDSKNNYEPSSYMPKSNYKGTSNYKVRLASYEDPKFFDVQSANGLGHIEQWTKGGWTIFILSGYTNLQDAENARRKAVNKGFKDAEVVLDNDGILERLKQN